MREAIRMWSDMTISDPLFFQRSVFGFHKGPNPHPNTIQDPSPKIEFSVDAGLNLRAKTFLRSISVFRCSWMGGSKNIF
jgi:hypothetical protein